MNSLSKKELKVLELLSEGLSNNEIADRLQIGYATVITHIANIYQKLNLSNGKGGDSSKRVKATLIYLKEVK